MCQVLGVQQWVKKRDGPYPQEADNPDGRQTNTHNARENIKLAKRLQRTKRERMNGLLYTKCSQKASLKQ